jgi:hypothetical protein
VVCDDVSRHRVLHQARQCRGISSGN